MNLLNSFSGFWDLKAVVGNVNLIITSNDMKI